MRFHKSLLAKALFAFALLISLTNNTKAQTSLVAGDIAFTGYLGFGASATPDEFSFVLLANVTSGTVINFTENGWLSTNVFRSGENTLTWTSSTALPVGTEVKIVGTTVTLAGAGNPGTVTGTAFALSANGDQILAYQGAVGSPTFISAIHMNVYTVANGDPSTTTAAAWDGTANTANSSALPTGLTTGVNAIWIGTQGDINSEKDNARFVCAGNLTTVASIKALIYDQTKWTTSDGDPAGFSLPTGCSYIAAIPAPSFTTSPTNTSTCAGGNASFTAIASNALTYQWQVDNGGGFVNITNSPIYSGATTTTLTITGAPQSFDTYQYRSVATNGTGSTNSTAGTLTVNPLPGAPTLLAKTPATGTVADGTNVSATFNAGSGGTGCTDDFRYTTNGGVSYLPYTPGTNISTTGLAAGTGMVFIEGRRANCSAGCQGNYVVLASWVVTPLPGAPTTLNAGDIAFTSYGGATDEFSFVLLKNSGTGTTINFTNNGWLSTNVFRSGEESVTWTSTAALSAGTEIKISGLTATLAAGGSAGTVTGTPLGFNINGDQILAYRGAVGSPTFISAIHMNVYSVAGGDAVTTTAAAWDGTANTINGSALPTGLTTGVNAIWIGTQDVPASEFDNSHYGNCAGPGTLGPITGLRAALNNQANWISDNNAVPGFPIPTGCLYLGIGSAPTIVTNPSPSTVCAGVSTSFTAAFNGAITYQWQVDPGTGFVNVVNDATYSGATTTTLNINATPFALNGYLYRLVATNVSGSTNSNSALLTVNVVPTAPTLAAKTPASNVVADGTPVSATFNAGSGGTGCTDDFRYTVDGGSTYLPYTPGSNISTTGLAAASGFVFIEGRRAACASTCQGAYVVLAAWRVTPIPGAASTLNAGDIAFSGYTSTSANDDFSFVLLRNIGPGTTINFTNTGWLSTNVFGAAEETVTWTAPAGGLPGGTEIRISGLTASKAGGGAAGTVTGTPLTVNPNGDQILAYRGTAGSPTFISAIHMNVYSTTNGDPVTTTAAAWDGTASGINASALPTGLTTGTNAIWIGTQGNINSEHNNAKYGNCSSPALSGSLVALRSALNNQANWITDDNTPPSFTLPTGCNYLNVLCPTITVTNPGVTTGTAGVAFGPVSFSSTGGVPTVTYSTASTLPTGLTLSPAGVLSGTPTQGGTFPIVVTATDGGGCTGNGPTYNLVISCPANSATATPSSQTICSGSPITNIVLAGGTAGTTYNWTRDNNAGVTGIAASGSGDIAGTLTNITSAPITVTFTITPVIYGCNGTTTTATVIVNPTPDAIATPSSQSICTGANITTIAITGSVTGTVFNWTRDNTGTVSGTIAASGSGDISGSLINATNAPITVTFTITPTANACPGSDITATVVVNPRPDATATPSSQNRCSGLNITPIVMGGGVSGTSFNWTRDQVGVVGGTIPASGSGNITGNFTNNTGSPVTVTFTITPTANSCPGAPITATVTVNPLPLAIINGGSTAAVCQADTNTLWANPNPNYTYAWGISNFTAPFSPLGNDSVQPANTSGIYLLTVTNQYGCVDTAMTIVNVADYEFVGNLAPGDALQTGRLNRFAVVSTCASPKACPGTFTTTGNRLYDSYTITNPRPVPVCAKIGINSFCATNIFSVAYTGSYNPTSLCTNYLADPGSSFTTSGFYDAIIPANGTIVVIVHEVNTSTGCAGYRLSVNVPRDTLDIVVTPDSVICSGQTATLTAPIANSYSWSPGGQTTRSITTTTAGNYSVALGYGNIGCNASVSQSIGVTPSPTVDPVSNASYCFGSTVNIPLTGSIPGTVFNWTNTNTAIGLGASGNGDLNFVATNATAGPISGTITVIPVNGACTGTPMTFTITVAQESMITSVTHDSICAPGGVVNLAATGNGFINWYDSATGGTLLHTGATYSPNVTATDTFYVESQVVVPPVTLLGMPAQSNTFPGNVRGYVFTAPADFTITSLYVPTTASSGVQHIAVVKFNGNVPPPIFSASTNAFTTLFLTRNNASSGKIAVNIQVHAGEVIGILGNRANLNSYAPGDYNTSIMGLPVQLQRLGMQFQLGTTNPRDIWREPGAGTSISRIEFEYAPLACVSAPRVPVYAVVKPLPVPTATPASQTTCSGSAITTIVLAPGTAAPTTYSWTRDNTGTVTGIAASGTTDISGTLTNTTNAPITVTFTITASAVGGCTSAPITATVVVNPTPTVNAVGNQVVCNGAPTAAINFSGAVTGTVFDWTNNDASIGLSATGTGDISSFTATNATNAPITATITVTPSYTNAGQTCTGTPITFTITVNPTPTVNAVADQVVCNTAPTAAVNFSGFVPGTSYSWTNNNTSIGLGATGTGDIPSFTATNSTNAPAVATITVTPSYTNAGTTCTGAPITFTITVNPTPTVNTVANQTVCNNANSAAIVFSGFVPGTVYSWTNNTGSIGLATSGTGDIASFVATNATNAPVVATVTVTPSYTNGGTTCTGTPKTFTITVNPTPTVNGVGNQTLCNMASTIPVTFTGFVPGTVYNWTNNTPSIGLPGTGSGDIASFTATNSSNAPVTALITVTPSYTNAGQTCTGAAISFSITVNPTGVVNPIADQTVCNGTATAAVNFTTPTTGGTVSYTWTNSDPSIGLASSGSGNIASFTGINNGTAPVTGIITVTPTFSDGVTNCVGTPVTFNITVNPVAQVNAVSNQVVCNNSATGAVNFTTSNTGGTVTYSWTNNTPSIGLVASGNGNIPSFTATNSGTTPVTATITVTPTFTSGVSCSGPSITFTITVNPTPTVNAVANQVVCNSSPTTAISFSGAVTGTVFNWTNSNTAIGLASASGTGNIPSFIGTNATNAPITATFTVTPTYTNGGTTCSGTPITFTITVNPTPSVDAISNQVVCNGTSTAAVTITGPVAGTAFSWTNNTPSIGLAASGNGNVPSFTATNTTGAPVTATITVTPSYTNGGTTCTGPTRTFTITVNPTPTVDVIANQVVCNNAPTTAVIFTGNATGTTYSWTNNTPSIGLAATGTGDILSFTALNAGTTPVVATITVTPSYTNSGVTCTGTPKTFTITVNPTTVITLHPVSQTVCAGTSVTFTTAATGVGITYQWQLNTGSGFNNIGGATAASYNTGATTAAMNGNQYRVVVTGTCGAPISNVATLTVNTAPNITVQPVNASACIGGSVTFSVVATGTALTYQWQVNTGSGFGNIGGATLASYTVSGITAAMNGYQYQVIVSGTCPPPATSTPATLTVSQAVTITQQPANVTICFGLNATFTVAATGSTPITYQWQVNTGSGFTNIPGATSPTLTVTVPPLTFTLNQYRAVVTNACGSVNSNPATLIIFGLPSIFLTNAPPRVCLTDTVVTLSALPAGGVFSGNGISGGNKFSATAAGTGVSTITYTVTNANGCISIHHFNITVNDCKERHIRFADAIHIYPNPSNGQIKLKLLSDLYSQMNVRVIDARGREVGNYRFSGLMYGSIIPMDLRHLPAGMYIVQAYNDSDVGTFRIVITH